MTQPTCPSCGGPLDPTHAPVARVRGTRIVTFCSIACADQGTAAGARAATPSEAPPVVVAEPAPVAATAAAPARTSSIGTTVDDAWPTPAEVVLPSPRAPARRTAIALAAVIAAGGLAIVAVQLASGPEAAATRLPPGPVAPAVAVVATPVAREPSAVYQAALAELERLLGSPSPRISRLAAGALARVNSTPAVEALRKLLVEEPSTLARIQIAYALARTGDASGRAHLIAALDHSRRDVRLDAARALVWLADDHGRETLNAMLTVESHRIGAAGLLARLGDARGTKLLQAELGGRSSKEVAMRAAVELGRAGDASVTPTLEEILSDKRYNVGAADALAALGDADAVPGLIAQLELSAMRVSAARWLRRLDRVPPLVSLEAALSQGNEAGRASAAEAILILAGPPELAEHE